MGNRLDLNNMLQELLGSQNVYFQPPPSLKLKYPCIVYEHARHNQFYADNDPYKVDKAWTVTYVDTRGDSEIPEKLSWLHQCKYERSYKADNLYHYQYRLIY